MNEGGLRIKSFRKNTPLFSLVTVVKNNDKFLEETIKSVLNQSLKDFEYIIVDGKSNDNTLHIIKKYENQITFFDSERKYRKYRRRI